MTDLDMAIVSNVVFGVLTVAFLLLPRLALAVEKRLFPRAADRMERMWGDRQIARMRITGALFGIIFVVSMLPHIVY